MTPTRTGSAHLASGAEREAFQCGEQQNERSARDERGRHRNGSQERGREGRDTRIRRTRSVKRQSKFGEGRREEGRKRGA